MAACTIRRHGSGECKKIPSFMPKHLCTHEHTLHELRTSVDMFTFKSVCTPLTNSSCGTFDDIMGRSVVAYLLCLYYKRIKFLFIAPCKV